jgi:hypothetical protein
MLFRKTFEPIRLDSQARRQSVLSDGKVPRTGGGFARSIPGTLLTGLVVLTIAGLFGFAPAAQADNVSGPTPWAVLRCQFSDEPQPPVPQSFYTDPESFYADFFTATGAGKGGMYDYWGQVSMNPTLLQGTQVLPWAALNIARAQNPVDPNKQVQGCIDATEAYIAANHLGIDLSKFYGLFVLTSHLGPGSGDGGWQGTFNINNKPQKVGIASFDFGALTLSAAAHEMGHGYGLQHAEDTAYDHYCGGYASASNPQGYGDYCDYYDVMGDPSNGKVNFTTPYFGAEGSLSGPGLNAEHLDYLGWIPPARRYVAGLSTACVTLNLAALGHTEVPSTSQAPTYFDVGVPFSNSITIPIRGPLPGGYTVEFRRATGWDRSMTDGVIIHSGWSSNGFAETFIVDNNGGPLWHPGDTFIDSANNVRITIDSFNLAANTAQITICRPGVPPPPAQPPTCKLTFSCPYHVYTPPDFTIQCPSTFDFYDQDPSGRMTYRFTGTTYSHTSSDYDWSVRACTPETTLCQQYPVGKGPQDWCAPPPPPPPPDGPPGGCGGQKGPCKPCPGGICQ